MHTLAGLYDYGKTELEKALITDANLDAWLLLEAVTGISRAMYFMNPQKEVEEETIFQYKEYIEKRKKHVPVQYILGQTEFMGLTFLVNEAVLVPRQDTELLVELVMQNADQKEVLDMCTGSGCIITSLAKLCNLKAAVGIDISAAALEVAKKNARQNEVQISFIQSDLFSNVTGTYDIIVSNPPYIESAEVEKLMAEVKDHEPRIALDGKEDGLYFYRKIVDQVTSFLNPGGEIYFEIGYNQGEALVAMLQDAGFSDVEVKKDLAGLDRVVKGKYKQ